MNLSYFIDTPITTFVEDLKGMEFSEVNILHKMMQVELSKLQITKAESDIAITELAYYHYTATDENLKILSSKFHELINVCVVEKSINDRLLFLESAKKAKGIDLSIFRNNHEK